MSWWAAAGWVLAFLLAGCGPGDAPDEAEVAARSAPAPATEAEESAGSPEPIERDWPEAELRTGGVVEARCDHAETHTYRIALESGQYLRLRVEQVGVDLNLRLLDPEGELLLEADRLIGGFGPEHVLAVAELPGTYSVVLHATSSRSPGRYEARIEALRPASAEDRRAAVTYRRFRDAEAFARNDRERAGAVWADALATWRELGEEALEAEVLARIGLGHFDSGEWDLGALRYAEAVEIFARAGERVWQLRPRQDLAAVQVWQVEYDKAIENYRIVVEVSREIGDRMLEGIALNGMGAAYRAQGEVQQALGHFEAALERLPEDDHHTRPLTLHNLAALYWRQFQDSRRSEELLLAALDLYRPEKVSTHAAFRARALMYLGAMAQEQDRLLDARRLLEEALAIETGFDRCGRATLLGRIAVLEDAALGRGPADSRMAEAFDTLGGGVCAGAKATLHLLSGEIAERRGESEAALAAYRRGRELAAEQGDGNRLADSLAGIVRVERARGRANVALEASRQMLAILEGVRPTVLRSDLRTAFFASAQSHFDLHIGLLTSLGAEAEAWAAAERARAQALRDLLLESGAGLRRSADPVLAERERSLQRRLNVLESQRLKAAEGGSERAETLRKEIEARIEDLEKVRGEIRRQSPAYAALTAPDPLDLRELQRHHLDSDTLLLEYRLGEETSWLWAVTRDSFEGYVLPPRGEIEAVAREAVRWTRSLRWPGRYPQSLCELSEILLGPAAHRLGGRRLVVVADGALEELSFAALPSPVESEDCAGAAPLVADHEVVHLPSVSALTAQRRLLADRQPAPGWLAMVADPVYGPDDDRLRASGGPRPASSRARAPGRFARLSHAGEEADAVLAELPPATVFDARGLHASKETITGGAIGEHRVVHFATHGVLHPDQPLLSFLALSQVSADGRPVDGDLYAHEIYDLEIPAELVVLSACDTARGRQVRGEGLVSGLPRAFLYAGAARVLVSLWPVPDRSTRDLMELFYRGLVHEGLPPGRALQEAQRSLWREGRPPYQWAGFVLQGDWRPLPPF